MDQEVKVSLKLLQEIANYLATKPYQEVANLMVNIQGEVSKNQPTQPTVAQSDTQSVPEQEK